MDGTEYKAGDTVIYGVNGVCAVDELRHEAPMEGAEARLYYILRPLEGRGMTISVPADCDRLTAKLRPVLSRAEIDGLLASVREEAMDWIDDRHERADRLRVILSGGVHKELLMLIRCIYERRIQLAACGKKLNSSDEDTLKNAERLVREEFAYSLAIDPSDVGGYIRSALGISES